MTYVSSRHIKEPFILVNLDLLVVTYWNSIVSTKSVEDALSWNICFFFNLQSGYIACREVDWLVVDEDFDQLCLSHICLQFLESPPFSYGIS